MKIEPTHKCFDDAMEMLEAMGKADPSIWFKDEILMIHGLGQEPVNGKPFVHAWLECGELAIFRVLCDGVPTEAESDKQQLREFMRITETKIYTTRQVLAENRRTGHFGPWHEPFEKFCTMIPR